MIAILAPGTCRSASERSAASSTLSAKVLHANPNANSDAWTYVFMRIRFSEYPELWPTRSATPNDHHQRWEPAARDFRIVPELNGWLPSAAWCGWAQGSRR